MAYYNYINRFGEVYSENPSNLSGKKTTEINANESFKLINDSSLYMNNGQIVVSAKDIKIYQSDIRNRNIWSKENVGVVKLNAVNNIQLNDSDITVTSITAGNRGDIHISGESFDSINSQIAIIDERKGISGSVNLDFNESIKMVDSQVVSIGQSKLTRDTNGNDINIKSGELLIKNSLISGFVEGNGERGVTSLNISGCLLYTSPSPRDRG